MRKMCKLLLLTIYLTAMSVGSQSAHILAAPPGHAYLPPPLRSPTIVINAVDVPVAHHPQDAEPYADYDYRVSAVAAPAAPQFEYELDLPHFELLQVKTQERRGYDYAQPSGYHY